MNQASHHTYFSSQLIHWHVSENKRIMPWKGEKNPYKIWISEVMLQQTRVLQGTDYYNKFIAAFPTIQALAAASEEKVYKLWEGLGYYSRCRNMIATASHLAEHGFPDTYEGWLQLKGVGPYTAAAIASFAYNQPHAVVDGNVYRVLSRYFGESVPIDSTTGKKFFNSLAKKLLFHADPALYNQAIMDLGAEVCTPKVPKCEVCPLSKKCIARKNGWIEQLPVKEKRLTIKSRHLLYAVIISGDEVLVRKRTGKDIWQNLHEFFLVEQDGEPNLYAAHAKKLVKEQLPVDKFRVISLSATYKQQLTHQRLTGQFITIKSAHSFTPENGYHWIMINQLNHLSFPQLIRQFLKDHPL